MFTGIIEEIGIVRSIRGGEGGVELSIAAEKVLEGTLEGDSIAVNGVCLTVSPFSGYFTAQATPQTLRNTSLGSLKNGSQVNLERAMLCGGRFGGHMVSGHVDACCPVLMMKREGIATLLKVALPRELQAYVAAKGSVTVDGVSLTVTEVDREGFCVSLIPHTKAVTTLENLRAGQPVNVEVDIVARYLESLMASSRGGVSEEFLKENGFF